MQVWNVLHTARWKCRTRKIAKNSPSAHHRTTLSRIFSQLRHVSTIGKKLVKQQYLIHMSPQYGEIPPTNGWDRLASLRSPILAALAYCTTLQQRVSAKLCGVVQGMELQNFRRGRHLYSAGRPSRWASVHILVHHDITRSLLIVKVTGKSSRTQDKFQYEHSGLM